MRNPITTFGAALLATTVALTSVAPAMAVPVVAPKAQAASSDVVQIRDRDDRGRMWLRKKSRGDMREFGRDFRQDQRRDVRRDFRRDGNYAWYNGQRGYRYQRRGYREYNGFWFPAGAFIAGALITGAIVNQDRPVYSGNSHVSWCYDRWQSYRASDNSYQPSRGPRRECVSPYG